MSENNKPPGQTIVAWTMRASNKNKRNSSRTAGVASMMIWIVEVVRVYKLLIYYEQSSTKLRPNCINFCELLNLIENSANRGRTTAAGSKHLWVAAREGKVQETYRSLPDGAKVAWAGGIPIARAWRRRLRPLPHRRSERLESWGLARRPRRPGGVPLPPRLLHTPLASTSPPPSAQALELTEINQPPGPLHRYSTLRSY